MAWKEYYIYDFTNTSIPASAGAGVVGAFQNITTRFDSDADFEVIKRHHIATDNRIRIRFQDDSYGRQFQNQSLDLRGVSGTILSASAGSIGIHPNNFMPFILARPYLIRAGTTYTLEVADFSGAANSLRMSFHGAKLRVGAAPWHREWKAKPPFDYTTGAVTLSANQTVSVNINIQIDAHFLVEKITGTRTGPALIQVIDGSQDRQWMNGAIHIDNFMGNSQFPNILPAPRFIRRGSSINITIQDLSGASNTVEVIFSGLKLF